jgi:hypothetical protein
MPRPALLKMLPAGGSANPTPLILILLFWDIGLHV